VCVWGGEVCVRCVRAGDLQSTSKLVWVLVGGRGKWGGALDLLLWHLCVCRCVGVCCCSGLLRRLCDSRTVLQCVGVCCCSGLLLHCGSVGVEGRSWGGGVGRRAGTEQGGIA